MFFSSNLSFLKFKEVFGPLHFHSAYCSCLKAFLMPKALLELVPFRFL